MITPQDLEEERRLFYVAITRAEKAVSLSYADTRMRNGKHESNGHSRFLRELAPQYLDKPLRREDYDRGFGAWEGERFDVARKKADVSSFSGTSRVAQEPVRRAAVPEKPAVIDPSFVPDPMTSFKVGDRIEHNRFGAGVMLEITGQVPDLKAKVRFDEYGEKVLLLKFAKLRHKG